MSSRWTRHLTREANILSKYCILQGLAVGPTFVFPDWVGLKNQLWTWQNGETGIHFLLSEQQEFNDYIANEIRKNPSLVAKYRSGAKNICDSVVFEIDNLALGTNKETGDAELIKKMTNFANQYQRLGETIIMTTAEFEDTVRAQLPDPAVLHALTAVPELSFEAQEERDRLKIVQLIEYKFKHLFVGGEVLKLARVISENSELKKIIDEHVEKYCWIPLNYEKELWDREFFLQLFQSYITESYDYEQRLNELNSHTKRVLQEKAEYAKFLSTESQLMLNLLEARSFVRLYRANVFSLAFYKAFPMLKEVSRRLSLPFSDLKFFTPVEIINALKNHSKLSAQVGTDRKQCFVMTVQDGKYSQLEGALALEIINRESPATVAPEIAEVKGRCAFPGVVRGRGMILFDAREMGKIQIGDILICNATNPDLIIAMRKAGAIVTEEGGVTSHAAIVSRELKVPCVIGTKTATKVFKDGDMVEVDAEKGIVRKI